MSRHPAARLLGALLVLALLGAALLRGVTFRAEMSDLLPPGSTPGAEFLLRELRSGAATTLLLAGIEGAPEPELARLSRAVAEGLRASGRFAFVGNGVQDLGEAERNLLFRYRYLLSPATRPALFEAPVLRERMVALLDGLRSAASPLLARFGFADPVGAFFALLGAWMGESHVALREGVWFAEGSAAPRALIIARGKASGLDLDAQAAAVAAFHTAFTAAKPAEGARLLVSGPGVFSTAAAAAVRADVQMISLLSGLLIAAFLWWRYRSLLMLAAVAVPLLSGTLAGTLAVALAFGAVNGAAFGFGMTMLGIIADYPVLLVTQRRPQERLDATARRLWPTLRLAAAAATLGLSAMLASGFPLLAQLGLFGATGLLTGVAVTRWALPWLLPGQAIGPRPLPRPLARALAGLRGARWPLLAVPLAALALLAMGGPRWNRDLNRLSPVPQAQRDLDTELRRQLGAPDVGVLIALRGADAETVLRAAERVGQALGPMVARGALGGFDSPARFLPSTATQHARQAILPSAGALRARLAEAAAGLPFRPGAFDRFLTGVTESHDLPPLTPAGLAEAPALSARLALLLSERGGVWQGLVVPSGVRDLPALRATVAGLSDPDILLIEVKAETESVVATTTAQALRWAALGGGAVFALLALVLGRQRGSAGAGLRAALRTAAPIAGALLVTLALLALGGQLLTPFHLVALLLSAGVGMDYALFLGSAAPAAPGEAAAEAERTLGSVLNCTVTTLLTFGLLAFCSTPVLRGIGLTVALGVAAAFTLALALAPRLRTHP
ncbi:MMPL family transporter [Roseomonas sp. E05]|uniref:MMPL family transporter n=1 Tax=Roseomonas sp. E05 TaxID=3046310 RepID=UPI0024B9E13C|nr:MMPL family transporter [Roseomonas sp. E05]MDJ0389537.1 MMPL family transporter [Roseomonas sp. E05]